MEHNCRFGSAYCFVNSLLSGEVLRVAFVLEFDGSLKTLEIMEPKLLFSIYGSLMTGRWSLILIVILRLTTHILTCMNRSEITSISFSLIISSMFGHRTFAFEILMILRKLDHIC